MLIRPDYFVNSVEELTLQRLGEWQLRALLLDVDCTLTRYRCCDVAPGVAEWIEQLRNGGIGVCLVSNGLSARIDEVARRLDLPCVPRAMKPLPGGLQAAMRRLNVRRSETAMVGDQMFADILAGHLARIRTILVRPIHPEEEPWFTRLKRGPERWCLQRMQIR